MMIRKLLPLVGAGALALVTAIPAVAQQGEGRGRLAACKTDVATFCPGVEAGGGRRIACLQENAAKLSTECAQVVESRGESKKLKRERRALREDGTAPAAESQAAAKPTAEPGAVPAAAGPAGGSPQVMAKAGKRGGRMAACRTDAATFCASAEKGGGKIRCLQENQAKLSPECQAVVSQRVMQAGNLRTACKVDRETLCANVQRGGGRTVQCLRENVAKLSPACGEALSAVPEKGKGKGKRAG